MDRLRWLGRLPGDLRIGDSFYLPLATSLVISARPRPPGTCRICAP